MAKKIIFYILIFYSSLIKGQSIQVDTSLTAEYLVDKILVGNGIRVGNVKISGVKQSFCYFAMDTSLIGMKSGLLLSTGNVFNVFKENTSPGTSGISWDYSKNKRFKRDRDLNKLCKGRVYDQIILEFDFVPFENQVSFEFSFASEEYTEYVDSKFNDVFGFFISGSGMRKKNIAVIPNSKEPITINNLNQKENEELFISNDYFLNYGVLKSSTDRPKKRWFKHLWNKLFNKKNKKAGYFILPEVKKKLNQAIVSNLEYDGFTKVIKASCTLIPWKKYHLKIAVGDVGDAIFDSGVFLKEGSFQSNIDTSVVNFKPYTNLYNKMNWDSIFGIKKALIDTIPIVEDNNEEPIKQEEETFKVINIYFNTDEYSIPDTSKIKLNNIAKFLNYHKNLSLLIVGHTDNKGSKKHNLELSQKRAYEIGHYLTTMGINTKRLSYSGESYNNPIGDNLVEDGRAKNRRVELIIQDSTGN
jgi:flagellar motor protein MotB